MSDSRSGAEGARLEVRLYQIADDALLACNRTDGTGWELAWADLRRDWMDATQQRFAYRCLPLSIANQLGFWVPNPVGFTALWEGGAGKVELAFDAAADVWRHWVNDQFGHGIVTWNTPFLVRTAPIGSRLLVTGPPNYFKRDVHALTGLIETDWMASSFTMNWKILRPGVPVRFERGEPLFQAIPLARDPCGDLERASIVYRRLSDDPALAEEYREWSRARSDFHRRKAAGEVAPDGWQKHYFHGVAMDGREAPTEHKTKLHAPPIEIATAPAPRVLVEAAVPPAGGLGAPAAASAPAPARARARHLREDAATLEPAERGFVLRAGSDVHIACLGGAREVELPTGVALDLPPGWRLEVRPALDRAPAPAATVVERSQPAGEEIVLRVRLLDEDGAIAIEEGAPLARVIPVREDAYGGPWELDAGA